jgi:hypothetical protein
MEKDAKLVLVSSLAVPQANHHMENIGLLKLSNQASLVSAKSSNPNMQAFARLKISK